MTDSRHGSGVSRRSFLKGSSAVAAAATVLQASPPKGAAQDVAAGGVVQGPTVITLNVNGVAHKLTVEPRTTLLDALRYQLELTGAKPVSLDGSSGASTVLVDGKPMMASTLLAVACHNKQITTIEGLGTEESPHPVQAAFLKHDAQQCGFCTPGFVIAVKAFLDLHPNATDEQIREGLNGNICRCGTYANVIQAATELAKGGRNA